MMSRNSNKIRNSKMAMVIIFVLVLTGVNLGTGLIDVTPAQAATSSLKTATTTPALSLDLAIQLYPSGAPKAVIAQNTGQATLQASVYAARAGIPVLVSSSGSSTTSVLPTLQRLNTNQVILISSAAGYFTASFKSGLTASSIAQPQIFESSNLFTNWSGLARTAPTSTEIVIAKATDSSATSIAASYAMTRGLPLVLWNGTTGTGALEFFFDQIGTSDVSFFGQSVDAPSAQMNENQTGGYRFIPTSDSQKSFTWAAGRAQLAGTPSSRVVTAPRDFIDSLGLGGVFARKTNQILAPAGDAAALTSDSRASEFLTLWKEETQSVTLVGRSLTAANLSALASPTTVARPAPPTFRVTNVTKTSTGHALQLTSVSGATSYAASDRAGVVITSSTQPLLAINEPFGGLLIMAQGSSGTISSFDLRMNQYEDSETRASAAISMTSQGTNSLLVLGSAAIPRLITRSTSDIYSQFPSEGPPVPVAITCGLTFTETGLDPTMQYVYVVSQLTNVAVGACNTSLPNTVASANPLISSEVPAPPTVSPPAGAVRLGMKSSSSPTAVDLMIAAAGPTSAVGTDSAVSLAPGDDYQPLRVRWNAYIPEGKVPFPGNSGDPALPALAFGGDGHGTNLPNESVRFRQDVTFTFGSTHSVSYDEYMGLSERYKCFGPSNCTRIATATASLTELHLDAALSGPVSGVASIRAAATLPLLAIAPPIDTSVKIVLAQGRSKIYGYHDNMPQHEAYIGVVPGQYFKVYQSPYLGYAQLPCLYSFLGVPLSACAIYFNAAL